jgi:spore coat polysaccharide biosynthesis protein SpsF
VKKQAAIVTIRNSSSRLPQKALAPITNSDVSLEIVIQRAQMIGVPVIVATSSDSGDDTIENVVKQYKGVRCFRGALTNKILRWRDCFIAFDIESAVLVDGDDLLYGYQIAKRALTALGQSYAELILAPKDIICGYFTYGITKNGIDKLAKIANDPHLDTDVITQFISAVCLNIEYVKIESHEGGYPFRLTLDYSEDLEFFRKVFGELPVCSTTQDITKFLINNPDLIKINAHRHKDYLNNQKQFNEKIKEQL